ncbi:MAG: aminodeoxychorismate synthase component I [Anaerofustis sp.]
MHQLIEGLYVDAYRIYAIFRDDPFSFMLESGMDHANLGRYSFIGSNPFKVLKSKHDEIQLIAIDTDSQIISDTEIKGDPFCVLDALLKEFHQCKEQPTLPFEGGAVGYLGYDLGHHLEKLNSTVLDDVDIPDLFMGFYDGIVVIDHLEQKTYVTALGIVSDPNQRMNSLIEKLQTALDAPAPDLIEELPNEWAESEIRSNFTHEQYIDALKTIHEYIRTGDIYQVNLTQRFEADLIASPQVLYQVLRKVNPAPFASIIEFGDGTIVSSSPERYLKLTDRQMQTRPIKGTTPRGKSAQEDWENRIILEQSEKDHAELLMIVDLERNDFGRVAKTGTVKVPELFVIETYPTVYHLVSTVTGELEEGKSAVDLIRASFPGGSITGAPKIRAMDIIDELEPSARNVYTGSIGYIGFDGDMDLNIVIRTFVCKGGKAYFQAGGGIVWDSDNESEYEETYHKAAALIESISIANTIAEREN